MKKKANSIKLSLVTDIHHGPDHGTKIGTASLELVEEFCTFSTQWSADMVVDLGDRISDIDRQTDTQHLQEIADTFKRLDLPRGHILGNHDLENLNPKKNAQALGVDMASRVVMLNGYHLIFWQASTKDFWPDGLNLPSCDLEWLETILSAAQGPCIIFTHLPLDSGSMTGNYYFDANPKYASYPEVTSARQIIEKSGRVILCVAGHVHWNSVNQVNGIPYLALHSLSDCCTTSPYPSGAWATLEIGDTIEWRVHGRDPISLTLPLPRHPLKWLPTLQLGFVPKTNKKDGFSLPIKAVLFDLDGVFYKGTQALPGGRRAINFLKQTGRLYMGLTNNAQYSPQEFSRRLAAMGIDIPETKILTPIQAVAEHLVQPDRTPGVYVLGSKALKDTLREAGLIESAQPAFVVVGWDDTICLSHLKTAVAHLLNGAILIATNGDPLIPTPNGPEPENGALVAFLERSSGQKALILGKPHPFMFKSALEKLGVSARETVMVGDTLETDILGAGFCGIRTIYINSSKKDSGLTIEPTMEILSIKDFPRLLDKI